MTAAKPLETYVVGKILPLQSGYATGRGGRRTARSVATLAQLRRGVGKPPGEPATIWDLTLNGVPFPGKDDTPSVTEAAAHTALTLYAVHQQSQGTPMHVPGRSLGTAVRMLVQAQTGTTTPDPQQEKAIRRRFDALVTASSFSEVQHHLRGLITQLRSAEIALDYGRLAQDLADLQRPERVPGVRIRWARDYHHIRPEVSTPQTTDPQNTSTVSTPEEDQ